MSLPVRRNTRIWEGAWPGQLAWTVQRDVPHLGISCPVHKLGRISCEGLIPAQGQLGISQCMVSCCIVQHSSLLHFISLHLYFLLLLLSLVFLLNCSLLNPQMLIFWGFFVWLIFLIFFLIPTTRSSGCVVFHCWLGLNHNKALAPSSMILTFNWI